MTYPRFTRSRHFKFAADTNGGTNRTLTGTTDWTTYPANGTLDLLAEEGDVLEVGLSVVVNNAAVVLAFDAVTLDGATPVTSFGTQGAVNATGLGVSAWLAQASVERSVGGSTLLELGASDIDDGVVSVGLRYRMAAATNRDVLMVDGRRLQWWVKNLGPAAEYPT